MNHFPRIIIKISFQISNTHLIFNYNNIVLTFTISPTPIKCLIIFICNEYFCYFLMLILCKIAMLVSFIACRPLFVYKRLRIKYNVLNQSVSRSVINCFSTNFIWEYHLFILHLILNDIRLPNASLYADHMFIA